MTATVPRLRRSVKRSAPKLEAERRAWAQGLDVVVGMDEVGRGSWAGPLVIAAVVIPRDRRVYKVRDSKVLTEAEREAMFDRLVEWCETWSIGMATHDECDELGMSDAQRLAASRALDGLGARPDRVLVDGNWDFVGNGHTETLVRGDRHSLSIATASIVAKVTRDRMLRSWSDEFPGYNFESNKGYPCPVHRAALQAWGPTTLHRRSWAFMDSLVWKGIPRFERPQPQLSLALDV